MSLGLWWLWVMGNVMCSLSVLGTFCTSFRGGVNQMETILRHPLALTRGVLCARLCSSTRLGGCRHNRSCIGFHPSHITVRSTATRVTLLRFVGTKGSSTTMPSAIRYSRLVRTCGKTNPSVTATARAGHRMCSFLQSISSHFNVKF